MEKRREHFLPQNWRARLEFCQNVLNKTNESLMFLKKYCVPTKQHLPEEGFLIGEIITLVLENPYLSTELYYILLYIAPIKSRIA